MKKRIKAFTILEVTIVMLLAGICISIAYSAMGMVSQAYQKYDAKNKQIASCLLLQRLLDADFLKAREVRAGENGIVLSTDSAELAYTFSEDYILRTIGEAADTFSVRSLDVQKLYRGQPSELGQRIGELNFSIVVQGDSIAYSHHKEYCSEELVNEGK